MADFYIVPPRLTVGTFDSANVVKSINTIKGDLTFTADPNSGVVVRINGSNFQFSINPDFYIKKSGDTVTENIIFSPAAGRYGLAVGSGVINPTAGLVGGLFYNTTDGTLKVYNGSA